MLAVKLIAVTFVITVFIREAESRWQGKRGSSSSPCSPRACHVSSWSTWSPCAHPCGTSGTQTRARTVTGAATCGGSCPHLSEIRSCNTDNCKNSGTPTSNGCSCQPGYSGTCCEIAPSPVDGGWSDWSDWSPCPPCVNALRNRSRTCTNPAPAFGGQLCSGHSGEMTFCPDNCPSIDTSTLEARPSSSVNAIPTPSTVTAPPSIKVSRTTSRPTTSSVALFNAAKSPALPSATGEPTSSGFTQVIPSSVVLPLTIPPRVQRILLGSLTRVIQRLQALLGGSLSITFEMKRCRYYDRPRVIYSLLALPGRATCKW